MKEDTKQKIIDYIKWDYGIDITEIPDKIDDLLQKKAVKKVRNFFIGIGVFLVGGFEGGVLSLLTFAYPACIALLLLLYIWLVSFAFLYYNSKLDWMIEKIRRKINGRKRL